MRMEKRGELSEDLVEKSRLLGEYEKAVLEHMFFQKPKLPNYDHHPQMRFTRTF
jgi:hypothetical protein